MPSIRITARPPGEAPDWVRQAWVGLVLPLPRNGTGGRRVWNTVGVLTGPRTVVASVVHWLFKKHEQSDGYAVEVLAALEVLSAANPEAARWWRENTPHMAQPGQFFVFAVEVSHLEPDES